MAAEGLFGIDRAGRNSILLAYFAFFVEAFDAFVPIIALAPAMIFFLPEGQSSDLEATLFYLTFGITFVGKPIGGILMGYLSDVIGRRRTTIMAIAGFGGCTILIGLLPGFQHIGYTSLVLLLILRFLDGILLSGQTVSSNPLAMENSPEECKGVVGAFIQSAYPMSFFALTVVTAIVFHNVSAGGLDSDYVQWGWRIPFFVGGLFAFLLLIYCVTKVPESKAWKKAETESSPLKGLFQGDNAKSLAHVFLVMSGAWFAFMSTGGAINKMLSGHMHVSHGYVTGYLIVSNLIAILVYLFFGWVGQKIGRKKLMTITGVFIATAGVVIYAYGSYVGGTGSNPIWAMILMGIAYLLALVPWALVVAYLTEAFPVSVRSTGYGVAFTFSVLIPSFFGFYMDGLSAFMPYIYTPVVLFFIGGVLLAVGAQVFRVEPHPSRPSE